MPARDAAIDQPRSPDGPNADQISNPPLDGPLDVGADAPDALADEPSPADGDHSMPDGASGDGNADTADAALPADGGDGPSSSDAGAPADGGADGPMCPPEMRRAGWSIVGAGFTAAGMEVSRPSLVVTTTDRPTLAWNEAGHVQALEWVPQDCAFELMGLPRFGTNPSLAAAANDHVVMASVQSISGTAIVIETFDGASWTRLYDLLRPTTIGANQSSTRILLDAAGLPVVGWIENQFSVPKLQVARWNGTSSSWVRLTDATGVLGATVRVGQTPNGFATLLFDLVLDSAGQPIVSWRTSTSGPTVARYTGTQWVQLGATLTDTTTFSSADPNAPVLRLDSAGTALYAVWSHMVGTIFSANVASWSGTTWVPLSAALKTAPGSMTEYGMAIDGMGVPIVASVEVLAAATNTPQQIFTYRYNVGNSWLSPAQPIDDSDPPSHLRWPSIIVDHAGRWVVTWVAQPTGAFSSAVYLARYTPIN